MTFNSRGVHHFVKRGLHANPIVGEQLAQRLAGDNEGSQDKLETWETIVLILEPIIFYVMYISLQYTLFEVLPALVMIEQPSNVVVSEVGESNEQTEQTEPDSPLEKAPLLDEEIVIIRQEPLTRNIRNTINYLQSIGGTRGRWRGFWASVFYHMSHGFVMHALLLLTGLFPVFQPVMTFVCHMAATVLLCRLHMTWTHVVISPPSPLPWYKRVIPGKYVFKSLALPSLRLAVAHQLLVILPAIMFFSWGPITEGEGLGNDLIFRGLAVTATALVVAGLLLLPASVHLTRVEASLLPAEVDTIVPFDRTFGGRVTTDSKWNVRYLAVMSSVSVADKIRISKYYVKATFMLVAVILMGAMAIGLLFQAFGLDRIRATVEDLVRQAEEQQHQGDYTASMLRMVKI